MRRGADDLIETLDTETFNNAAAATSPLRLREIAVGAFLDIERQRERPFQPTEV